ncbi:restriction endonuclease subunit M [Paenibacillus sp. FSL R5-0912]|uniref:Eco57I restriction-modification methylase domain-containing protein n=1 Tax=Paenibacillus sp. FSL R5-0912 TaxID=1536771 RepID=UPI0004F70B24|nr:restriction endonuclease subunit M [Paenibacillus sp. FSL R5-0912]AIQ39256.1 modification methylase [Paenibacillus sp. FSL R5-0912]
MRNIAFKDYKKKSDIHGTVLYPAVMVAPVQKSILADLIDTTRTISIFDPFHGSGTSLYEALEISGNVQLVGCDINPLANLITKVKLQGITHNITSDIHKIKKILSSPFEGNAHTFVNINKWFREDIIISLTHIRQAIKEIDDQKNRLFFWCMFSDIVRKYSNSRSSTYKLHTKNNEDINKMENNSINDFIKSIELNWYKFNKSFEHFRLYKGNTLELMDSFSENNFDICITSPPYGDNNTTVPYGQFSMLALYWIDDQDLVLEGWELDSYAIIDSNSLGGAFSQGKDGHVDSELLVPYLEKITPEKHKKILRFFSDYFLFLDQLAKVTSSHIIMTLGNRTVDGVKIDLKEITVNYLTQIGFITLEMLEREIVSKRTPKKISRVKSKPVSSMNKEYVIVMEKKYDKVASL